MIIKNAQAYTTNHEFKKKDILLEEERILKLADGTEAGEDGRYRA